MAEPTAGRTNPYSGQTAVQKNVRPVPKAGGGEVREQQSAAAGREVWGARQGRASTGEGGGGRVGNGGGSGGAVAL